MHHCDHGTCKHTLKHCGCCDTVYCSTCKREWRVQIGWPYYYPYSTYTIPYSTYTIPCTTTGTVATLSSTGTNATAVCQHN